jgi:aminoglycoside phosphotransferase (APT) family kinase protein
MSAESTDRSVVPRTTEALELGSLSAWLADHVDGFDASAPPEASLLAGGRSNLTYALTDASGRRYALRRPPLGHVMPKAHDMAREFRVLSGLGRVGFPVPPAHVLCEDLSVIGVPFLVMGFVDGRVLAGAEDTARLTPDQADTVSQTLVRGLADLHRVDVEAAGLSEFGRPAAYVQRQIALWGRQWENTKTRDLAEIDRLAHWLQAEVAHVPDGMPWSLVHGDYRLDNVILDPHLSRLRAVLDWEMSTLGDPVADLAITLVYWTQAGDGLRTSVPVAQDATSAPGFWTRDRILDEYVHLTGLDVSHLRLCVALACYKLAVIMESIHFRTLAGQQRGAAADRQEDMGAATEALALLGLSVVELGALDGLSA